MRVAPKTHRQWICGGLWAVVLAGACHGSEVAPASPPTVPRPTGPALRESSAASAMPQDPSILPESLPVPDCEGGTTTKPLWLRYVVFSTALCVQAPTKKSIRVDYGQNLIAKSDARSGFADVRPGEDIYTSGFQVYYALSQLEVPAGKRRMVWGVCGGAGARMDDGAEVLVGPRLRAVTAGDVAQLADVLSRRGSEIDLLADALPAFAGAPGEAKYRGRVIASLKELDDLASLLRGAVITADRDSLRGAARIGGAAGVTTAAPAKPARRKVAQPVEGPR